MVQPITGANLPYGLPYSASVVASRISPSNFNKSTSRTPRFTGSKGFSPIQTFHELWKNIRFYTPIIAASLICTLARSEKTLFKWESKAIYNPARFASLTLLSSATLRKKAIDVTFESLDKVKLNGWHFPAQPGKPTIVLAHGSMGNMNGREDIMKAFVKQGYGVFAFDYRGYGNSEGIPSEKGLIMDFEAASHHLATHPDMVLRVPYNQQIPLGESLGGGVVVGALSKQAQQQFGAPQYRAVLLLSTFTSIPEVFSDMKRQAGISPKWFPFENKMTQQFRSIDKIKDIQVPLLFVHGDSDKTISIKMSEALKSHATGVREEQKAMHVVKKGSHSDLFRIEPDKIINALETLLAKSN